MIFSGMPVLILPKTSETVLDIKQEAFIEWHILKVGSGSSSDSLETVKLSINGQLLDLQYSLDGQDSSSGLFYKLETMDIAQKVTSYRLFLNATEAVIYTNKFQFENDKGKAKPATIKWTVEPQVTEWSEWSNCPISCVHEDGVFSQKRRSRNCTEGINSKDTCSDLLGQLAVNNVETTHESCPMDEFKRLYMCPVDFEWTTWGPWGQCSANCGPATQTRTRHCIQGIFGGAQCPMDLQQDTRDCSGQACPRHCKIDSWLSWSGCGQDCIQEGDPFPRETRKRDIVEEGSQGGMTCDKFQIEDERICSNVRTCAIDGLWAPWGMWSSCSTTCSGGQKIRMRVCNPPRYGGLFCQGEASQNEPCNQNVPCACKYTQWSSWSFCSTTCGIGNQDRSRRKSSVAACSENDDGEVHQVQLCQVSGCPKSPSIFKKIGDWLSDKLGL